MVTEIVTKIVLSSLSYRADYLVMSNVWWCQGKLGAPVASPICIFLWLFARDSSPISLSFLLSRYRDWTSLRPTALANYNAEQFSAKCHLQLSLGTIGFIFDFKKWLTDLSLEKVIHKWFEDAVTTRMSNKRGGNDSGPDGRWRARARATDFGSSYFIEKNHPPWRGPIWYRQEPFPLKLLINPNTGYSYASKYQCYNIVSDCRRQSPDYQADWWRDDAKFKKEKAILAHEKQIEA